MKNYLVKAAIGWLGSSCFWLLAVNAQGWTEPHFQDAGTDRIKLDVLTGNRYGVQMEEEIPPPFKLVTINYAGPGTPRISRFTYGERYNFEHEIRQENNLWGIYVKNRQDYETEAQQRYEFDVVIIDDDSVTNTVSLTVITINIFDNSPEISYEGPCVAEELRANFDTNCRFLVKHPDGTQDNPFRMVITGPNNEDRRFTFSEPYNEQKYSREYNLIVRDQLFFKERSMYSFTTTATDVTNKGSRVATLLQVIDVPNEPPMWTIPFATARFLEKTPQSFHVAAIDGDTDIDKAIWFELEFLPGQDYSDLISIDKISGDIEVKAINRDALNQEVFPFSIIAYKFDNRSWAIDGKAVIIVDDVNDNAPVVTADTTDIRILENTYLTLPIDRLTVNDIDLGEHATYSVYLDDAESGQTYAKPFLVIPDKGYKEAAFTITVADTALLDFEVAAWQKFGITVVATESFDNTHIGRLNFDIELINWNDELPIFEKPEYEVNILETTPKDVDIIQIKASDRDIGDRVIHTIVGPAGLVVSTDGTISTSLDNVFDYDRQKQVIVQIIATDTLVTREVQRLHTAYAQLTINLIDVNNQTPEIRMPRGSPNMDENQPGGYVVTKDGIIATDTDQSADLRFSINWEDSYATKAGQEAPKRLYENCFIINVDRSNPNRVIGYVEVNTAFAPLLIDYEEYEVIYLAVSVTDVAQEINEGTTEAVLTIRINDLNDNYPLFIRDTLSTQRSVVEEALPNTLIGTVFSNDIDGPQFNKITYAIRPKEETPADWVTIHSTNGEIRVAEGVTVGCDIPRRAALYYFVKISDGELETESEVRIDIIDINNKFPQVGEFEETVRLYEKIPTGTEISTIPCTDADRDAPHNTCQRLINYRNFPILNNYFEIDPLTGLILARLVGAAVFDRDRGEKFFDIHVDVEDNYQGNGNINTNNAMVKLVLLDVNDNAPELPSPSRFKMSVSENSEAGTLIETITAIDIDDETTPNAQIGYAILDIKSGSGNALPSPDPKGLFAIDETSGALRLMKQGRGFYGDWLVTVEAFDHGHLWDTKVQLRSSDVYTVHLEPYNFHAPQLVYPSGGGLHRFSFYDQQVGRPLTLADDTTMPNFSALDADGGIFGDITFSIVDTVENSGEADFFEVVSIGAKSAQLYLRKPIEAKFYHINVRAEDGGGRTSDWATNVNLVFVDMTGEPVFDIRVFNTDFTENVTGLEETRELPAALDPKNVGLDDPQLHTDIFYFIDPTYEDAALFQVDPVTRMVTLTQQLDRESIDLHYFRVIASNRRTGPQGTVADSSYLVVEVKVNDVNDNSPTFENYNYGSGITVNDPIGKVVLTVKATDPDLNDIIRYAIKPDTFTAIGNNLDAILGNPFELNPNNGALILNFAVSATMTGYISFEVQAFDLVNHEDTASVKVFIISESNRVTFVFLNDKDTVDSQREWIARLLTNFYEFECNIDDVVKAEVNGVALDTTTNMRAHFIKDNEAIEASQILSRSNDVLFITSLKSALLVESINLMDVPNTAALVSARNEETIIQIALSSILVLFAVGLVALIAFYTIRIRRLNRQLRALEAPLYEPDETKFKHPEAPTTNKFAEEGSNPVHRFGGRTPDTFDSNGRMYDNFSLISTSSADSEFVGIDNDPTFAPSGKITGANTEVINNFCNLHQKLADHSNGFGTDSSTDHLDISSSHKPNDDEAIYKF